jgi:putative FmdB family regulatory protein
MPTYDYRCSACGHTFEELQTFSEEPLTKCPKCKKNKLERLFSGGGAIIFKGAGFYETDYRRAGEKTEASETPAATTETKAETKPAESAPKTESKPETKSESKGSGGKKKGK